MRRMHFWQDEVPPTSLSTERDVNEWKHNICTDCWCAETAYEDQRGERAIRTPRRLWNPDNGVWLPVMCCFCGRFTTSGILMVKDPDTLPCKGEHGLTYDDAREGVFARQLPQEAGGDISLASLMLKKTFKAVPVSPPTPEGDTDADQRHTQPRNARKARKPTPHEQARSISERGVEDHPL